MLSTILRLFMHRSSTIKGHDKRFRCLSQYLVTSSFPTGKLIKNITCNKDASQSYALYIPITKGNHTLPVIYFFDPHGDGNFPLTKYISLADKYGFILIGSNNSKNGNDYSMAENIWQHLFADTKARINIDAIAG